MYLVCNLRSLITNSVPHTWWTAKHKTSAWCIWKLYKENHGISFMLSLKTHTNVHVQSYLKLWLLKSLYIVDISHAKNSSKEFLTILFFLNWNLYLSSLFSIPKNGSPSGVSTDQSHVTGERMNKQILVQDTCILFIQ